jgi:hypothetical protein
MSKDSEQGKDGIFGQNLPGTGGDIIMRNDAEQDVEGHRVPSWSGVTEDGSEAPADGGADVEGHLYTSGPTTQGEFARRGPGRNPHGER